MTKKDPDLPIDLHTPIQEPSDLALAVLTYKASEAQSERVYNLKRNWVPSEKARKMVMLARCWGISTAHPKWELELLLRLAENYLKGFQVVEGPQRRPGRPRKDYFDLVRTVDQLKAEGKRVTEACLILSKRKGPWKGKNPKTLETRYHEWSNKGPLDRLFVSGPVDPFFEQVRAILEK